MLVIARVSSHLKSKELLDWEQFLQMFAEWLSRSGALAKLRGSSNKRPAFTLQVGD